MGLIFNSNFNPVTQKAFSDAVTAKPSYFVGCFSIDPTADDIRDAAPTQAEFAYFFDYARVAVKRSYGLQFMTDHGTMSRLDLRGAAVSHAYIHGYSVYKLVFTSHMFTGRDITNCLLYVECDGMTNDECHAFLVEESNRKKAEEDRKSAYDELLNSPDLRELKFKSESTGAITYCAYSAEKRLYTCNYFYFNGGHRPCEKARKRDIVAISNGFVVTGYKNIQH